jgi:hypothetical protein
VSRRAIRPQVDHQQAAAALRARPGVWLTVAEYRNADTVRSIRDRIRTGQHDVGRWYQPAGAYETRTALTDDGTLLEARYLPEARYHPARRRTPPVATMLAQTDAARVLGQIDRREVVAGPEGARRIAARHQAAYGDVWNDDADNDQAWADAIDSISAGGGA